MSTWMQGRATIDALIASGEIELDPPLGKALAPYTRIRRTRNAGDYFDDLAATADDVRADLPLCRAIVELAAKVIYEMPEY